MKYLLSLIGMLIIVLLIVTPLKTEAQLIFGVSALVMAVVIMQKNEIVRRFIFAALVITVSGRYIYWRATNTMEFNTFWEYFFGCGMFAVEVFFLVVLLGSYIQQIWVRQRKPEPLPKDHSVWPNVDVFIPSYNEPLDMVRSTVIAAQGIDWPRDKLNIYLLDDGKRPEFKSFALSQGINYLTRTDNKGAKAGNLNNALKHSKGDLIAIFDCDHAPTRSFLQMTVGFFLRDKNLALVQTPHHFYNADPFERNLEGLGQRNPNEGHLFYGLIQDGNDFWNASFFCGSCALLRRKAINNIGGFATETVTEDAHTSLRLHQKKWKSAYLNLPQASGLATESLRDHVGQRLRWARGMLQIFRKDNPLIIPGLTLAQRICYSNAMMHFLFPLPRIVLLTAPLAYLLFGVHIISASPDAIAAYAIPHIIIAVLATYYLQSRFRQAFLTEVYEAALAFQLLGPTILTLINPSLGKFNVTNKDSSISDTYFDWKIVWPQLLTVALLLLALGMSIYKVVYFDLSENELWALGINMMWACISAGILLSSIAVGLERKEQRLQHRVNVNTPILLQTQSGHTYSAVLNNISLSGAKIECNEKDKAELDVLEHNESLYMSIPYSNTEVVVKSQICKKEKNSIRLIFSDTTDVQLRNVVRVMFGRSDAWLESNNVKSESFLRTVKSMAGVIVSLLSWGTKRLFSRRNDSGRSEHQEKEPTLLSNSKSPDSGRTLKRLHLDTVASFIVSLMLLCPLLLISDSTQANVLNENLQVESLKYTQERQLDIKLKDIGVNAPVLLQGGNSIRGFAFSLRSDDVVTTANMTLRYSVSPGLDVKSSQLNVVLNGETIHAIALNEQDSGIRDVTFEILPYVLLPDNTLEFHVLAKKQGQDSKEGELDKSVWVKISHSSVLNLVVQRLPLTRDLKNLPAPFFDKRDHTELVLPFVFTEIPQHRQVQSAAVVASYWGSLASFRRASFPVQIDRLPQGNGIVFLSNDKIPADLEEVNINIDGPSLELIKNPRDPSGQLLLIKGRNDNELLTAAKALSVGSMMLQGQAADVGTPLLQKRYDYDAPAWLPVNRPVTFGEIEQNANLEGYGISPGLLTVNFKISPDIFLWDSEGIPMTLNFRYAGDYWLDLESSRLDVLINDKFIKSVALLPDSEKSNSLGGFTQQTESVIIPPYLIYGENQLQFFFDLKTKINDGHYDLLPENLRVSIDADSSIDLSSIHRYAKMPNLAYLAQSGLPFSRKADMSQTAVVLPEGKLDKSTLEALFIMIANISGKTEYPALGIEVIDWRNITQYRSYDFLLLGSYDNQPLLKKWKKNSPIKMNGSYISVNKNVEFSNYKYDFQRLFSSQAFKPDQVAVPLSSMNSALYSFQSPLNSQRTVIGMIANDSEELIEIANTVKSKEKNYVVRGDFVALSDNEALHFYSSKPYYVGSLPWYIRVQWFISHNMWLIPFFMILGILIVAISLYLIARNKAKKAYEKREYEINNKIFQSL